MKKEEYKVSLINKIKSICEKLKIKKQWDIYTKCCEWKLRIMEKNRVQKFTRSICIEPLLSTSNLVKYLKWNKKWKMKNEKWKMKNEKRKDIFIYLFKYLSISIKKKL